MSGASGLSSVAYKKGNWMRYTLWGFAAICIVGLLYAFFNMINYQNSPNVPQDYKFSVTDDYSENSKIRTTYYVYDDRIFVENESFDNDNNNRTALIYDNIDTKSLNLNPDDTTEICELGFCHSVPKVLATIKQLISHKVGREYIGF